MPLSANNLPSSRPYLPAESTRKRMRPALLARALFARVVVVASFKAPLLHSVPPRSSSAPPLVRMASDKSFRNPHNLPTKVCVVCNRPFTWRKKWENCWDEVKCCSKRCQSERKSNRKKGAAEGGGGADEGVESAAAIRADEVPTVPRGRRRKQQARMSAADDDPEDAPDEPVGGGGGGRSESSEAEEEGHGVEGAGVEEDPRAARKAARKAGKLARRAVREGRAAPGVGRKACDLCGRQVDLLVRCQVDASKRWQMACGKCWATDAVSGGVVDGSGANPHYLYGGLWKNLKKGSSSPPPPAAAATRAQVGGLSSDHDDDEGVEGVRSLLNGLGVSAGDRSS